MLRIQGIGLFIFIPIVLVLYLVYPLGVLPSILLGMGLMFGHRFIARPWMMKNINKRDIWTGNLLEKTEHKFQLIEGKEELLFYASTEKNRTEAVKFFNFLRKYRFIAGPAILGTVFWYLVSVLLAEASESLRYLSMDHMVLIFKMVIAVTVILVSILYKTADTQTPVKAVFPVHNLFLLGISWTLWIFRLVGIYWVVKGLLEII